MMVEATPLYAQTMAAMHATAFAPRTRWGADALALQVALPGTFGLIEAASGFILVRVAADEAEILTLAVVPSGRRRGVASALLVAAMTRACLEGARTLFLEVAEDNTAARVLYAAHGFAQAGRRRGYYGAEADALILRRELSADISGYS